MPRRSNQRRGVYHQEVGAYFEGLPEKFSFETEVLEPICKLGKSYGFIQDSKFIDIGIPSDYKLAQEIFKENNENEES